MKITDITDGTDMPTIDDYARLAARDTRRWYGATRSFAEPNRQPPLTCEEWFKRHWAEHPTTSPLKD